MFKPMEAGRSADKFKSFDELAKRLVAYSSSLDWPAPRALAVKIGDIDRGDRIWWTRRPAHATALAALLEVPLVDLGLHDAPAGDMFEFATFPELPPIALVREASCEIGFVDGGGERRSDEELAFWLGSSAPRHAWRGPEHRISWLRFQPGSGLSFFWAALRARARHDHISTRRLLDAAERLRQPGNLILRIEQPCEDADMIALGRAHPDLNVLIVAAFGAPTLRQDAPTTWLPAWNVLTGAADQRMAELKDPRETYDGMVRYEWRLHDDWRARLLEWVEKRISRATSDTLFTARGVTKWLASFPPGWQFVEGPADLLAVCRLCHLSRETALPRAADVDAGQRLLQRVAGADITLSRRFTALVTARLEARDLPWRGALTRTQWAALGPVLTSVPDEAALMEIANATNISARRQRARAISERIRDTGLASMIQARLLVETHSDTLALAPRFLVDLVARDRLMQVILDEPVERWAMYCLDTERRALVDAALGSMSPAGLLVVLDRLKTLPARNLAAIAGAEAMFREVGKRVCGDVKVSDEFECLAGMLLSRLTTDDWTPQQWTRPDDDEEEQLEWATICWAWSLWRPAPPVEMPATWAWHFPGWATDLSSDEMMFLWLPQLPDRPVLAPKWQRMIGLAAQLARQIAHPPGNPPDFLKPMLLVEALRDRWRVDSSWLDSVIGHADARPVAAFASLLLGHLEQIGPTAAARLLPALMEYVLSGPGDSIRSVLFYRSRIRTWVLQNISLSEAISCLTEDQLEALWNAPHTLPPHLLVGMLQNPDTVAPARLSVRKEAVRVLDADHVDTLSRLLATESLGGLAADQLWKVAPAAAERLLDAAPADHAPASLRLLVLSAPVERTGPAARVVLSWVGVLPESERIDWARQRLSAAGAHAETLGRILGLDIGTPPRTNA